jgi:hypothetical protein
MSFSRQFDGSGPVDDEPVTGQAELREHEHARASTYLASATLACPSCDAPVALTSGALTPGHPFACPYCEHAAPVRDFLSLGQPTRPTRVELHVVPTRRVTR